MKLEYLHRAASHAITGCLSSSPILLFLFEASLPSLRFIPTHFIFSSYKWTFLTGLARLGMKLRLSRPSWRALLGTLTCSCLPVLLLEKLSSLPWNPPSFTVELTFSYPCFRSNQSLSCEGAAIAHLDFLPFHDLD